MKKIPTLYIRDPATHLVTPEVTPGCEWVLAGEGRPTPKWDGTCCMILGERLYKRYDAKHGKTPPSDFVPCEAAPDPLTGHWTGWLLIEPTDRYHLEGFIARGFDRDDGTYELVGPKVQGNPHQFPVHLLIRHGAGVVHDVPRDFDSIAKWLSSCPYEGVVWHHPSGWMAKIKRRDFGLPWPIK